MSKGEEKISIFSEKLNTYSLPPFFLYQPNTNKALGVLKKHWQTYFAPPLLQYLKNPKKFSPFPIVFSPQTFQKASCFLPIRLRITQEKKHVKKERILFDFSYMDPLNERPNFLSPHLATKY